MSAAASAWNRTWLRTHCLPLEMLGAWRGVESQYMAASMQLVDSFAEQDVLEQLLALTATWTFSRRVWRLRQPA